MHKIATKRSGLELRPGICQVSLSARGQPVHNGGLFGEEELGQDGVGDLSSEGCHLGCADPIDERDSYLLTGEAKIILGDIHDRPSQLIENENWGSCAGKELSGGDHSTWCRRW